MRLDTGDLRWTDRDTCPGKVQIAIVLKDGLSNIYKPAPSHKPFRVS